MSLVHRFAQRVGDTGANADHGRLLDAQLHRDRISGPEADPANVPGKAIWIFRHDLDSVGAVGPEYPHRTRRADAVAVQEHVAVANGDNNGRHPIAGSHGVILSRFERPNSARRHAAQPL